MWRADLKSLTGLENSKLRLCFHPFLLCCFQIWGVTIWTVLLPISPFISYFPFSPSTTQFKSYILLYFLCTVWCLCFYRQSRSSGRHLCTWDPSAVNGFIWVQDEVRVTIFSVSKKRTLMGVGGGRGGTRRRGRKEYMMGGAGRWYTHALLLPLTPDWLYPALQTCQWPTCPTCQPCRCPSHPTKGPYCPLWALLVPCRPIAPCSSPVLVVPLTPNP